ncbi:MAG: pantetheine-phosphate adenylyltransferase [Alphaproteobacteria bacterium]|nr:MAG: pantetheine-phosphate adenylyltransferase [Alphaproteobacteria bacterium]
MTAIYPGTFDPITLGHLDIVRRGLKLVDKLVIGVTTNPDKKPLFSAEERLSQIVRETSGLAEASGTVIEVVTFDTLLMDFAVASNADIIIRGLRAVSDFEYEFQMAGMNSAINSDIETVFLMADARLQSIASRLVKEIAAFGGDITPFVPSAVAVEVMKKQKT